jgi:hypothetical protein
MLWFFAIPLLITNVLLAILPSFTNYRNIIIKTTTGHCTSGRHGRRGRNNDRHNTWWYGSSYRKKNCNKEDSPKTKHRKELGKKERDICRKIDLLQYFDPIIIPSNMFVIDDDAFYDARYDLQEHKQEWIPTDPMPTVAITTKTIYLLVNSIQSRAREIEKGLSLSLRDTACVVCACDK